MNQRERLEKIQRKHEEIQRKREIRLHRILLAAAAALIVVSIIVLIAVCANAISKYAEEKRAREAEIAAQAAAEATVSPTPKVIHIDPNVISDEYYENSAFMGNSFADDLFTVGLVPDADFFARTGLTVTVALEGNDTIDPVVNSLKKSGKDYDRIFLIFGENELGWINTDLFEEDYGKLIDKVKKYCPDSNIYLLAITPVSKKASDEEVDGANNDKIREYNEIIKSLAEKNDAVYVDMYDAVADKDGNLPADAASDGIPFGKDYYEKCLLYIQNTYK